MLGTLALSLSLSVVPTAVTQARELGYSVCDPEVVDAASAWTEMGFGEMPADFDAWAAWPEAFGVCRIGVAPQALEDLSIAQHEVCHLATGPAIAEDPLSARLSDPYHEDQRFLDCVSRMAYKPVEPVPVESVQFVGGGHVVTTNPEFFQRGVGDDCEELQALKYWIEWSCDAL